MNSSTDGCHDAHVTIALGERGYRILIGNGLLQQAQRWPALPQADTAIIVSNPTVAALHGAALEATLRQRYRRCLTVLIPDGEQHKTWDSINTITTVMLENACDRKTTLFALGGGVVGDIAGFAAACYMRGVPVVQVPTTLLAQVDSSVGGKTAINHPLGKNMIGAFHQPVAVLCDLATLATLPEREYRSGLAEVIKYGPIADASFLTWLEAHMDDLLVRDEVALTHAVQRSCEIKAMVVSADEREAGLRATLNFGHTFAHAIEGEMGYGQWLHGEAVACGMVLASSLSVALGLVPALFAQRLRALIARAHLPTSPPSMTWGRWAQWMRVDKKADGGSIHYILIDAVGHAVMRPVPDEVVANVIAAHNTVTETRVA